MTAKKQSKKTKASIVFPASVLAPVSTFLTDQLQHLRLRKKEVVSEDPFKDLGRATDNASPDTDAEEQFGHARSMAIKAELDRKIVQTRRALTRIKLGKYGTCANCGKMIDTDRLMIYPEAALCINCESKKEKKR